MPDFEVSALKNLHPPVNGSFALKFNFRNKAVVFSGDTAYCPAVATFAQNADYLVHEVMHPPAVEEMVKKRPNATKLKASILSHHTSTADVGKIASAANAKNLVINHFIPPDDKSLTDEFWINAIRPTYAGNIIVGKDLLQIPL
jgi:ribonuclease BN (tRNA processing enzyme)